MKTTMENTKKIIPAILAFWILASPAVGFGEDPWEKLRNLIHGEGRSGVTEKKENEKIVDEKKQPPVKEKKENKKTVNEEKGSTVTKNKENESDPWARLRALYLPFSEEQETTAIENVQVGKKVSGHFKKSLKEFENLIAEASERFDIPKQIVAGLIMVESGGNPKAKAPTSSARGLTQTISSTFQEARKGLLADGIAIKNDPYDPKASIMAGCWYLDQMYGHARKDNKPGVGDRKLASSWKYPLQYYYAGPAGGRKDGDIVIIYAGGKKVVVNKKAYSEKVMRWAKIMEKYG